MPTWLSLLKGPPQTLQVMLRSNSRRDEVVVVPAAVRAPVKLQGALDVVGLADNNNHAVAEAHHIEVPLKGFGGPGDLLALPTVLCSGGAPRLCVLDHDSPSK